MKFAQSSAVYFNYSLRYAIHDLYRLGYDGIEIWGGRPHMYRHDLDDELEDIVSLLGAYGMTVCNFIPAQFRYPSLLCSDKERLRRDSVEYIKSAVDNAAAVGARTVDVCPGMVPWDKDVEVGWRQLRKSLEELADYAQDRDTVYVIEPAHRFESNLILTVDDCLRMIDQLKSDRFGVLLDTGHCNVNGEDFREVIPRLKGLPLHIHIDDNNGDRDAHLIPGRGAVDFAALAEELHGIGYDGFVSAELGPAYVMDPTLACKETLEVLGQIFGERTAARVSGLSEHHA